MFCRSYPVKSMKAIGKVTDCSITTAIRSHIMQKAIGVASLLSGIETVIGASYNDVNELTSQGPTGTLRFRGNVNVPVASLTVGGNQATVDTNGNFVGYAHVDGDNYTVAIIAADYSGNIRTNTYGSDRAPQSKGSTLGI